MEGWLPGTDISCSFSSSYFPPLLFRNAFLQNGTVQWGVLPHASCCNLHLDFSLLNQYIPAIILEPPSLWATTAESHQFQPAAGLWAAEAPPFPEKSCLPCFIFQYWHARTSKYPFSSLLRPLRQTAGPTLFILVSSTLEKWLFADKMCQHCCSWAGAAHMAKDQPHSAPFLLPVTDVCCQQQMICLVKTCLWWLFLVYM